MSWYGESEWEAEWTENSIIVYNIWQDEWVFYKKRSDIKSLDMRGGDLEFYEDTSKQKRISWDDLYEMIELSRIIKNREYYEFAKAQTLLTNFVSKTK